MYGGANLKKQRRELILELIREKSIETQEELLQELNRCGYSVTQSTISRDIKLLGLIKTQDQNRKYRYAAPPETAKSNELSGDHERLLNVFKRSVIRVDYAMNNVVVKCYSGMAQGACVAFDTLFSDCFIGTLGGEDTILAITRSEADSAALAEKINGIVG